MTGKSGIPSLNTMAYGDAQGIVLHVGNSFNGSETDITVVSKCKCAVRGEVALFLNISDKNNKTRNSLQVGWRIILRGASGSSVGWGFGCMLMQMEQGSG